METNIKVTYEYLCGILKRNDETDEISKQQLIQIRELERQYQSEIVCGKISRAGIQLLSQINRMYEHRMTTIVPSQVRSERATLDAVMSYYESEHKTMIIGIPSFSNLFEKN